MAYYFSPTIAADGTVCTIALLRGVSFLLAYRRPKEESMVGSWLPIAGLDRPQIPDHAPRPRG